MSSFVIFWLTPPFPSGDDVIYERPLTEKSGQKWFHGSVKKKKISTFHWILSEKSLLGDFTMWALKDFNKMA